MQLQIKHAANVIELRLWSVNPSFFYVEAEALVHV